MEQVLASHKKFAAKAAQDAEKAESVKATHEATVTPTKDAQEDANTRERRMGLSVRRLKKPSPVPKTEGNADEQRRTLGALWVLFEALEAMYYFSRHALVKAKGSWIENGTWQFADAGWMQGDDAVVGIEGPEMDMEKTFQFAKSATATARRVFDAALVSAFSVVKPAQFVDGAGRMQLECVWMVPHSSTHSPTADGWAPRGCADATGCGVVKGVFNALQCQVHSALLQAHAAGDKELFKQCLENPMAQSPGPRKRGRFSGPVFKVFWVLYQYMSEHPNRTDHAGRGAAHALERLRAEKLI